VRHVFGPVPSRRLGYSLGVDPVPPKTCTMDCVYCELGPTTDRTACRGPFVDVDAILDELRERLREPLRLDHVTISGSGEPTLNLEIGRLIGGIRGLTDVPIAVLTNGSLLTNPEVRTALRQADVVAPSLDAVSANPFKEVNRPDPSLDPGEIARCLAEFARGFRGRLWLESLFVLGMNDDPGEIRLIRNAIEEIQPDRVHVNTVVRPPAVFGVQGVSASVLREIAAALGPRAEVIASPPDDAQSKPASDMVERIVSMAARRPVTIADVTKAIGTSQAEAAKTLSLLVQNKRLTLVWHGETQYYVA